MSDPKKSEENLASEALLSPTDSGDEQDFEISGRGEKGVLRSPQRHRTLKRIVQLIGKTVVVLLCVYGAIELSIKAHGSIQKWQTANDLTFCNCGDSTDEAISLGCEYVPLAAAWLPPKCRDEELEAEFNRAGPDGSWSYYKDRNGTAEYDISELGWLSDTGELYHTTRRWHIVHCVYYWKKLARSKRTGVPIEPRYDGEGHIDHCMKTFLKPGDREKIATRQGASLISDHAVVTEG
ncbi:hypothetical protein NA57DRAFT_75251 [Rhizodiscina lignyota]|uniref:Uncharacterized protein n=1 Tax=Rhizodiscina lignyota TaxID=1504668 RepID=A0A9P4M6I1_9PEZI|nr:hypothetical protein NA57DRAFT_75251 [Rhizodiscina lignyota]